MAKMTFTVSLEEFGKKAAEFALDEITYNDLTIREWAEKIASGEFQPVRYGRWVYDDKIGGLRYYQCTNCRKNDNECLVDEHEIKWFKFCPKCGAQMDAEDILVHAKDGGADE